MSNMAAYSNANNFAVKNRVDERTGQYGLSIAIPKLVANSGTGPNLEPVLDYNSMGGGDVGYGEGWDLNFSRFVEHAYPEGGGALSLSTGEHFTVDGIDSISEKKLDTFHFHKDGEGRFRVVHRSGVVEVLENMGEGKQRVALPTRIYAPTGQWIELKYANNPIAPGWFCLTEVRDGHPDGPDKGRRLLEVTYSGATVFTRYPDDEDVRASHRLEFKGRQLQYAIMPDQTRWEFDYQPVHGQTCVSKVTWPTKAEEHVEYGVDGDPGHSLPGVAKKLPRVKRHRVLPGYGQPEIRTVYDYSAENYMGNGGNITWRNNGRDNLYDIVDPGYSYWCKTTRSCAGEADLVITTRYDRFHRTATKTRAQGKEVTLTEIAYHGELGEPFAKQPPNFLTAKTVTTTWQIEGDSNKTRSEVITTEYNPEGNLTKEIRADGSYTELEYFDANGEPGRCPAEPNGFKKHVKRQTVYPSKHDRVVEGAIPQCTDFTYKALDTLKGRDDLPENGKIASTWLAIEQEELSDASDPDNLRPLSTVRRSYLTIPGDAVLHGRMRKRTTTLHGEHDGTDLGKVLADTTTTLVWKFSRGLHKTLGNVLQTTQTAIGHKQSTKVSKQSQHSLTGQVLENVDIHDTVTRFTYDTSDRLTSETSAPDDVDRRAKVEYRYVVSPEKNCQETENNQGVISRVLFDGLNRVIKEERICDALPLHPGQKKTYDVYSASYNAFGQLEEETTYDHLPDRILTSTSKHRYDNWGNRYATVRPDEVTVFTERSPFGSEGDIVTSWEEYPDQPGVRKNQSVTTFNRFNKPERVQTLDEKGDTASTRTYRYDGFGRSVEETFTFGVPATDKRTARAEHKRTTGYKYDVWGRMTRTDRPDGSALSREFARHSTEELATSILLHPQRNTEGLTVCKREFDDIDRMVSMTVGPHKETREYVGSRTLPDKRITKSGRTFNYEYDLAVGASPTRITAGKNQKLSRFKYSMASADITEAENEQGKREYNYTDQGYLLSESWTDNQSGKSYTRNFLTSLQGRMLENNDGDNSRKVYDYDDLGRLHKITQGSLEAVFCYNSAGLLHTTRTTSTSDASSTQQLLCTQNYDHRGRETSRTLKLSRIRQDVDPPAEVTLDERTLKQVWRDDNMLHSRTLIKAGEPVLTETFDYDDRDRLYNHRCEGSVLPTNSKGRAIINQAFEFDDYDNIYFCLTEFADGKSDEAFYDFFEDSPFQLKSVSHSLTEDYPALVTFDKDDYDADGNMLKDEQGNSLVYDEDTGQLTSATAPDGKPLASFRYDGHGQLVGVRYGAQAEEQRRYEGYRVGSTLRDGLLTEYLFGGEVPLGMQQSGKGNETRLYMASSNNSVIAECAANDEVHEATYSAYGELPEGKLLGLLGFNAEAREQTLGWYMLGRGFRAFNPGLMRFQSPDNMAPEVAGINPYVYCLNNPVMWQDPTGHYSRGDWGSKDDPVQEKEKRGVEFWLNIGVMVVNVALTITFTVVSMGAFTPLAIGVVALGAAATVASAATQVAAEFTKDPKKKKKLAIAYLSLSIAGTLALSTANLKGAWDKRQAKKKAALDAAGSDGDSDSSLSKRSSSTPGNSRTPDAEISMENPELRELNTHEARRPSSSSGTYDAPLSDVAGSTSSRRSSTTNQASEGAPEVQSTSLAPPPPDFKFNVTGHIVEVMSSNGLHRGVFTPAEINNKVQRYQELLAKNFRFDP
ncbi:RHS repeat-associated core domain-containing protein [Pseudomonas sp. 43(2021)]|uniref:RHS repeat-associated core domain-containing protein n=1 Tax=Pseudomonas sp. 43(2021) TaxID=2813560 RepID=UPI001A9F11FC|nr:RHS repeat-associated core domain-containing protein [Pseudomonas sp. 43(2021)]